MRATAIILLNCLGQCLFSAGSADVLAFGLSHIAPSVAGIARLDDFFRWACGHEAAPR